MKILYVITGLAQGGAERVVCDLADKMYEKGHNVKIAYLTGDILTQPVNNQIEIVKVDLINLFSFFNAYKKLSEVITGFQPDIVHAHMIHANLLTRLVRISTPIKKLICTAHSANEGGKIRMIAYRFTHYLSDLTTNVSDYASKSFIQKKAVPKNGIFTVYNGIDFNNFKYDESAREKIEIECKIDSSTHILLAVGRFHEAKNYPNLLKAFKILKEKSSKSYCLLIAGDGELRLQLEKLIIELNLEREVILLGRRSDISKLMSACDIFILSSDYEGLPTVLIEALACQAHVVSTNVSGASEIIGKDFGKIVPIQDSDALAQAIFEINLKNLPKNYNANIFVKNKFDLNMVSEKWINIYNEK